MTEDNRLETEEFFLNTLDEIREKYTRGDHFSLIKASGSLRILFVEGHMLVSKVNKYYRADIKFHVNDYKSKPPIKPDYWYMNIDPSRIKTVQTYEEGLSNFLDIECLSVKGYYYTVRDVIKVCANVKGGSHFGNPKPKDKEKLGILLEGEGFFRKIIGSPTSVTALADIVNVALSGLVPLEKSVRENIKKSYDWTA